MYRPDVDIANLMMAYGQEINHKPQLPDRQTLLLRARLVFEEALEFVQACGCEVVTNVKNDDLEVHIDIYQEPSLIEYADSCADIKVVTYGAELSAGIPLVRVWNEVYRSNMSKVFPDGTVHRREDGKVIKPEHYFPPDLKSILGDQA